MGLRDIEKRIAELGKKASDGKLVIGETAGGSFTMFVFIFFSVRCVLD